MNKFKKVTDSIKLHKKSDRDSKYKKVKIRLTIVGGFGLVQESTCT